MAVQIILKNSAVRDRNPTAAQLADGEIALNFHESGPYLSCKDRTGEVWSIAGVAVTDTAPGSPNEGRFWYSTATDALNVFADGAWRGVGGGGGGGGGAVDQIIGGAGLGVTPGAGTGVVTIAVNPGNGIEIDGDTVAVELAGDQDGLEFDGGALRVSVATADQIGGIRVGNNLQIDGDGILSATGGGAGGATNLGLANHTANNIDVTSDTGDDVTLPAATDALAGLMTAGDKANLDGLVAANGTDLAVDNRNANTLDVTSSTGNDVTLPSATDSEAGLMTAAQVQQLEAATGGLNFAGAVDLTGTVVPLAPNDGDLFVHTGPAGGASAEWANVSTLNQADPVAPGDLVAFDADANGGAGEFIYIPTGGVQVGTDLDVNNRNANTLDITSSTGDDVTVPAATNALAGLATAAMVQAIEDGSTPGGGTGDRPDNPNPGDLFFDTDLNILVYWDGTEWQPLPGGAGAQNLGYTPADGTDIDACGTVTIDGDGTTDATLPGVTADRAGLMTPAMLTDLGNAAQPGEVPSGGTDDRPAGPNVGDLYYDTDINALLYWDGTTWREVSNTAVGGDFLPLGGGNLTGGVTQTIRELTANNFNLRTGNIWNCAGGAAFTVPEPTNMVAGMTGIIRFVTAPAGWAGAAGDPFAFPGGTAITPGDNSVIPYYVRANNQMLLGFPTNDVGDDDPPTGATVTVTTTSFTDGNAIDGRFVYDELGCNGDNDSPQLTWSIVDIPAGRTLATWRIFCLDLDAPAGSNVHWDVRDIDDGTLSIAENAALPVGATARQTWVQPGNQPRANGWAGPCPPAGENHRYNIIVTAVLDNGATVQSNTLVFTRQG